MMERKNKIMYQLADFSFFQIEVIADFEVEGKIYKDIKQRNNDSILTPENWKQHKETFFTQRIAAYKVSYTLAEKIKLELSGLEKLPVNNTDYQILKDRYKAYLEQKQVLLPQTATSQKLDLKETLSQQITHGKRKEIAKEIINKYKTFKGVELRILLNALFILELFPKNSRKDALFHRCCVNDFDNVGKYQSMEAKAFKKGFESAKGKYIKSDHEERRDEIVKFLQSIISTK
jgi:hypothetical protein